MLKRKKNTEMTKAEMAVCMGEAIVDTVVVVGTTIVVSAIAAPVYAVCVFSVLVSDKINEKKTKKDEETEA